MMNRTVNVRIACLYLAKSAYFYLQFGTVAITCHTDTLDADILVTTLCQLYRPKTLRKPVREQDKDGG
jgi:hypothetical protein